MALPRRMRTKVVPFYNSMWGRMRGTSKTILAGVEKGHERKMQLVGVGYRVNVEDENVVLNVGYTNEKKLRIPRGITCSVEEKNTVLVVKGLDLVAIGRFCGKVQHWRKPEPYKGKGIRYFGQEIKLKSPKGR